MMHLAWRASWYVSVVALFAGGCGGGVAQKHDYIPQVRPYHYIHNVILPTTVLTGQPLELTVIVKLPEGKTWLEAASSVRGRQAIRVNLADQAAGDGHRRLEVSGVHVAMPECDATIEELNTPPFSEFEWRFPGDFVILYERESFSGVFPALPQGTYDLYWASGFPPCGSFDYHYVHFGSFEVVASGETGS